MSLSKLSPLAPGSNIGTLEYEPTLDSQKWELISCEDPKVEEARILKEAEDAKEELGADEVDDSKEDGEDKKEDPESVDKANKQVIEDKEKEEQKKKDKEEDGEDSAPKNSEKK